MQKNLLQPLPASTSLFYFSTSFSFQFRRFSFCFNTPSSFFQRLTFSFLQMCCPFFSPKYFFSPKRFSAQKISPYLWFSASFFSSFLAPLFFLLTCCPFFLLLFSLLFFNPKKILSSAQNLFQFSQNHFSFVHASFSFI